MANDTKGKSKARASPSSDPAPEPAPSNIGGASNAAQTLASALRTTMASSQLGSLMQGVAGSKEGFQIGGSGGGAELRDWLTEDLRASGGVGSASSAGAGSRTAFRSLERSGEGERLFEEFERGLVLGGDTEGSGWQQQGSARWQEIGLDPRTARVVHSHTELDAPLHALVRANHAGSSFVPAVHARPSPPAPLAQSDDIFALLDAESHSNQPDPSQPALTSTLSHFDSHYRPPSPSHPSFTAEQAQFHLTLAEAQASAQGQQELLVPRPDNQALQEGVYAATPEQALRSIFEGGREESTDVVEERGSEVVRKITKYFGATSYVDDVYGVSPVLREVVEEVRSGEGQRRERAVQRLESLWRHLSSQPPQPGQQGAGWVDDWLVKNT